MSLDRKALFEATGSHAPTEHEMEDRPPPLEEIPPTEINHEVLIEDNMGQEMDDGPPALEEIPPTYPAITGDKEDPEMDDGPPALEEIPPIIQDQAMPVQVCEDGPPPPQIPPELESKISIIGHSFVSRLHNHISCQMATNGVTIPEALNITGERIQISIDGRPGAKISDLYKFIGRIKLENPRIICIDIGSNDLCAADMNGQTAIQALREAMNMIERECDFIIFYVFYHITERRTDLYCQKPLDQYNREVRDYNRRLVNFTRSSCAYGHWRHRGLLRPDEPVSDDGIHPSTVAGLWKYQKSIRNSCIWSRKQADEVEFVE